MSQTFDTDDFAGARFDEFLNLGQDQRVALAGVLGPICDEGRKRARTAQGVGRFADTLGLIAANVMAARAGGLGPCFYSRGRSTYSSGGAYNPPWLAFRVFIDTIDKLTAGGFLKGRKSKATGYGDAPRSTFEATDAFVAQIDAIGIGAGDVVRDDAAAPVLVLKGTAIGKTKPWLQYRRDAEDILALDQPVREFNLFLRDQDLQWDPTPEALAALAAKRDEERQRIKAPDVGQRRLRRVFNDGSWERGGRFYGGWWQSVPSDLREFIRINGEEVVELDFGGFLPRAIYHLSHLELPGDAYEISAIRERADHQGMDWRGVVRPSIKKMLATILNARSEAGLRFIGGIELPRRMSKLEGYQLIKEHHQPIEASFFMGRGLEVMKDESNICQRVLSAGVAEGIPVLPIHDSFIVPASQENWLRGQMIQGYFDRFGFNPLIG